MPVLLFCLFFIVAAKAENLPVAAKAAPPPVSQKTEIAIFAMGCFWSGEASFLDAKNKDLKGISSVDVGYTGGTSTNPSDKFHEGHREAVRVVFDPSLITYEKLLDLFWRNIDPFDDGGQFKDRGPSYKVGIFYMSEGQRIKAEASKQNVEAIFRKRSLADIQKAMPFYKAHDYHQDYKARNPLKYNLYEWRNGHIPGIEALWKGK